MALRLLRTWIDRVVRFKYGPPVTLLVVAAGSLAVLRWSHLTWRNSLTQTVAALDNVQQARLRLTRAYLVASQVAAGDPTARLDQAVAHLQAATAALDDWLAGRSTLLGVRGAPLRDPPLRRLAGEYRTLIEDFQRQLRSGGAATPVDRRIAFAALEGSADAIDARIQTNLQRLVAEQGRRYNLMLGGWIGFLVLVGVTVQGLGRARRRAETSLRRNEERYRVLSTLAPAGIFRCDAAGRCLDANPEWRRVTGRDDWAGVPWFEAVHPEDRPAVAAGWARLTQGDVPFEQEFRLAGPGATQQWALGRCRPERGSPGELPRYIGTLTDVTARKGIEAQLRQAQKMEAVGQMTGGIAHDFRNILTIILASAEAVEEALPGAPAVVREDLAGLQTAARRGADVTKKLLAFSRLDRLALVPLDLREAVHEALPMLRRLVPAQIGVELDQPAQPMPVEADANALTHMLANLVANARDAMPEGGTVRIALERVRRDAATATGPPAGEYVRVRVADTGSGMDEATQARIFDPFFTTKPPGAGTGLGMPMVLGLIKDHRGAIEVRSAVGQGTTVSLDLPLADQRPARASGPLTLAELRGGTETILLVEDEASLRRVAQRTLESLGYRVLVAQDGRQALELLRRGSPRVDLVVSDSMMPHLTGTQLLQAIRDERLPVRFLFASGYAPEEAAQSEPRPVDVPYIMKPWTLQTLAQAVRATLDQPRE